jgi:3-deoxy-7-phosphoheptulonate synthase
MNPSSADDLRITRTEPIEPPATLLAELPLSAAARAGVVAARTAIGEVLAGRDSRLLCIVGPCSVHDVAAARDYAGRLKRLADELSGQLLIVMRVYFAKPRTTVGWKGLINDPELNGSFAIGTGLRLARHLLVDLAELGLPTGTEFLDPVTPHYLADAVAWGAIGARTVESQLHREVASGLPMPVGFKNATSGSVKVAVDALVAAREPHRFLGATAAGEVAVMTTAGNPRTHLILRGGTEGTNFGQGEVADAVSMLTARGLEPRLMIDSSHGNSGRDAERQPAVAREIATRFAAGEPGIMGLMLESHLVGGRQSLAANLPLRYGQSITDACLGWEETDALLREVAALVARR